MTVDKFAAGPVASTLIDRVMRQRNSWALHSCVARDERDHGARVAGASAVAGAVNVLGHGLGSGRAARISLGPPRTA